MRLAAALCLLWITSAWPADIRVHELPVEARVTLERIRAGGPFPYPQDGRTFSNRERLLPTQRRGYYREYTVATPGLRERGARRIVAGRPGEFYYTDDHYRSFRRILE
ncbi:MAG TPA: ribonuclease domain-containing protein [Burkholderiales bacterium]|nr:ribonuclease domain-containing protein [Burkholderiales bacterium]